MLPRMAAWPSPEQVRLPFAGGSGAGVSITPVGFLVVDQKNVGVIRTDGATPLERVTELAPKVLEELRGAMREMKQGAAQEPTAE